MNKSSNRSFRNDIQFLRGIASLAVLIYHTNEEYLPGGYLGVDIFYIISGFLILASLKRQNGFIVNISKRCKRLLPASYIVLVVMLISINKIPEIYRIDFLSDIQYAVIQLLNVKFYMKVLDYYSPSLQSYILHYWSLSVEWHFFIIILFIYNLFNSNVLNKVLFVLLCLSFIVCCLTTNSNHSYSYFSIESRLWEFICGMLCSVVTYRFSHIVKYISMVGILICMYFYNTQVITYPGVMSIIPTILVCLFLLSNEENFLFNSLVMVFIGNISFSLYLVHYVILKLSEYSLIINYLMIIISTLLLYYLIEKPTNRIQLKTYTILSIVIGITVMFIISTRMIEFQLELNNELNITQKMEEARLEWIQLDKTYMWCGDSAKLKNFNGTFFIGDSHILQWFPIFLRLNLSPTRKIIYFNMYISSILSIDFSTLSKIFSYTGIIYNIFLSHSLDFKHWHFKEEIMKEKWPIYLKEISKFSNDVYVIQDTPFLLFEPFSLNNINNVKAKLGVNATWNEFPVLNYSHVKYINVKKWFCQNDCDVFINGRSLYKDDNHLLPHVTIKLLEDFSKQLNMSIIDRNDTYTIYRYGFESVVNYNKVLSNIFK